MVKCSYCQNTLKPATGKMYVKTDCRILYFCSRKCEKNMLKLGRKAREWKWTAAFEKGAEKAAEEK